MENDYKIYGYRVDAIHSITFSILNIMARRSVDTEVKLKPELPKSSQGQVVWAQFADLKDSFLQNVDSDKTHLQTDSGMIISKDYQVLST